ncbi:hypothetical protein B7P43_G09538 [Cryptotermes secundus]|uniref:Ubiquitin-like protease family profile domain-containing protein n=1 Tax=Cryptotermes secundus TaxID=105785 RepID=A0A2J7QMQ7_9NEOP|nr:hypothetical protein B7P43_G09538 [Cryptotermes secundus]
MDFLDSAYRRKKEPKLVPGKLAVCHFCGYTSLDFFRCQRCRRRLPENCKSIPVQDGLKKKLVKEGTTPEKFFSKTPVKGESSVEVPKGRVRGRTGRRTKSKLVEEPVCLTLSSDDEESAQSDLDSAVTAERALNNGQRLSTDDIPYTSPDPEVTSSARGKEPIIPEEDDTGSDTGENQHTQGVRGGGRELDMDGIVDGSIPGCFTLLQCRTVRIGSYKVVPKDRVLLSSVGIRIAVPAIEDDSKCVTLSVDIGEIVKVLIHFGRGMPVLFLYTVPTAAARVRAALSMESKLGPYYDPTSPDETQRRITLLPERLHEDSKVALKNIFGPLSNVLEELSNKEANDILVRASPKEVQNMMKKAIGMSPLKSKDEIQTILVYPPPPCKGGIPINTEDYACLGEDQFLNDVIIDFYLKYLTLSVLSEEDQSRTHVFSSFFYKRLTTRPAKSLRRSHPVEDDPKLSPAEKRHSRVKSWTKNINIFQKDFIIIPINEHCHWFLAIICFPGLKGSVRFSDDTPIVVPPVTKTKKVVQKKNAAAVEECVKGTTLQIGSTTITPVKPTATITLDTCGEEGSDRDEAEADDDEMEQGTSEEEDNVSASQPETPPAEKHQLFSDPAFEEIPATPVKPVPAPRGRGSKPPREPIKQPCILIFDSLAGASRSRVVATLRDYLRIEYKVKEGKDREFNKDTIKGSTPRVPQQTNFTDCGVYVLQYVESFFQDPIKDYYLPMKNLVEWFSEDVVSRKREEIQKLLLRLLERNNVNIESLNLPKLSFSCGQTVSETQEDGMCDVAADVNTSSLEIQSQEETVEGGLVFTCTEEDDYGEEESDMAAESNNVGNSSGHSSPETNLSPDKVGGGGKRSLVDYPASDEGEEHDQGQGQSPMDVENATTPVSCSDDGKRNNTMLFLKTKRIERHSTRGIDSTPLKKMRTRGHTQSTDR